MMKIVGWIISITLFIAIINLASHCVNYKENKTQQLAATEALDIKESRTREDLLLKEASLLQYQIDVIIQKEKIKCVIIYFFYR